MGWPGSLDPRTASRSLGSAPTATRSLAAVRRPRPDLVLMDLRMRRVDGIAATRLLHQTEDPPPVLVVTTFDDDDLLWGAIEAGAAGFVLKDTPAAGLIAAARAVAAGGAWFDAGVTPRVLAAYRHAVAPTARAQRSFRPADPPRARRAAADGTRRAPTPRSPPSCTSARRR